MNVATFEQQIRGTVAYTKQLMMATKSCVQLMQNDTYFIDSWFSGAKTA